MWYVYSNFREAKEFDKFFIELYEDNLKVNGNERSDFPSYLRADTHQIVVPDDNGKETRRLKGKGFYDFIHYPKLL